MTPSLDRRIVLAGLMLSPVAGAAHAQSVDRPGLRFTDGVETTGWLDFDFWGEGKVFIDATVNDRPASVLLDSGVSQLVMDAAYARSLGLDDLTPSTAIGLGGDVAASVSRRPATLRLGSLILTTDRVLIVDLSALSRAAGRPLQVLLGRNLFDHAIVDLDFPNRRVAVHRQGRFTPPADAQRIPVRAAGGLRSIPITLEGRRPVQAVLDIGHGGAIEASSRYLTAQGLLADRRTSTTATLGVEGKRLGVTAILKQVKLGDTVLTDVPITAMPTWSNDDRGVDAPAYVGIQVISRFRLVTDFGRDRLWLVPSPALAATFRRDRAGLRLLPLNDHYEVFHVAEGGPAQAAGLREGDSIVAVEGAPVIDASGGRAEHWNNGPAGRTVELTLADGATRRLTLSDYY